MKKLYPKVTMLILLIGSAILQLSIAYAQTFTANYSISDWSASGSFTFQIGTAQNSATNQTQGFIKMVCPDGDVVEITPQVVDSLIVKLESDSIQWANSAYMSDVVQKNGGVTQVQGSTAATQIQESVTLALSKLRDLESLLEDQNKMQTLINQLQTNSSTQSNTTTSSSNWNYTLQTIRSIQVQISGTLQH